MKTKIRLGNSPLLGFGLCVLMALAACQQEMNPVTEQIMADQLFSDAGRIHNEMIAYYYTNRMGEVATEGGNLDELLELSWKYLDENGYDARYTNETRLLIEEKLSASELKSATGNHFSIDTASFITQLATTGSYSKQFQKEVKKILSLAHRQDVREVVKQYVNSTFSGIKFHKKDDTKGQQLFVSIFNGSYDFWENYEGSDLKSANMRQSSWVIINDGIGGILGSIFGPVGSIVTATAFSVGTNEDIHR